MIKKKDKIFSDHFISRVAELLRDYIAPEKIDKFVFALEDKTKLGYFSPSVEYNIQRILETNYDRIGFVFDSFRYPHYLDILFSITSNSNFLTEIVIKNPEYLYFVLNPEILRSELNAEFLTKEIYSEVSKFRSFNSKLNILKSIKRRYTLLIGVQDILGILLFQKVTEQISILAVSLLSELFNCCIKEIADKYSINSPRKKHCLIALGKLGGGELNYSSDVDLMLLYDKNSKIGKNKNVEYFDFISEVIQLFSSSSTNITDKGFLYRIDFRLRPDGKNSPLCRTYSDTVKYYETRGEDWERQMLIKADFINGDFNLYSKFSNYLKPFIFPTSFSISPLLQISKMKKNIERQFPDDNNIKLCKGGIRDIEFIIQALQLINGGNIPELHIGNSLVALDILTKNSLLKKQEKKSLTKAYIFYRQIEHFLQLDNDKQTHSIPKEIESLNKLSIFLGFRKPSEFLKDLDENKLLISKMFDKITKSNKDISEKLTRFDNIIFGNRRRANSNYAFIEKGISSLGQKSFDKKTITLFSNFEYELLNYLSSSADPDKILDNFAKVLRNIIFPSILYSEFQNKKFLEVFLKLCEYSQKTIDMMSTDKSLIDFFLTRQVFSKNYSDLFPIYSTQKFIFLLSVQLALKLIDTEKTSRLLAEFLSAKIFSVSQKQKFECDFFIGGLGSFGTKEMTFASDVDLIFISQNVDNTYKIQKDFESLVIEINKEICPFKVDLRLRPEGNKGPFVWDISKLDSYFSSRARIWEFQSLNKLRFVSGEYDIFNSLKKLLIKNVKLLDPKSIKKEILMMRTSLKQSRIMLNTIIDLKSENGGISDINFFIDSYILQNSDLFRNTIGKSRKEVIKKICTSGTLLDLYKIIKMYELADQNISNSSNSKLSIDKESNQILEKYFSYSHKQHLIDNLKKKLSEGNKIILKRL